eukprot:TRINITY_DN570_c0_g1_i1.p3 TRINITY_DN570_c0_g1~~TRINITY_DN570_c0_g1_i1.p3  ORF type:complete len:587 (-),score=111.06 TRINITY_DN570_c0_g1_i1:21646-23406(-)
MDKEKAKEASAKAKEAFIKKDFPTAIKYYTEAISFDPTDHLMFSNRSACYASIEQYEDALEDANKCVELKPDFVRGYGRKGLAEFYLKKYADAEKSYSKAVELDPNNEQYKEGLARAKESLAGPQPGPEGMFGSPQEILKKLMSDPVTKEYFKDQDFVAKLQMCQTNPQVLFSLINSDPRFMKVFNVMTGISMEDLQKASKEGAPEAKQHAHPQEPPKEEPKPQEPPKPSPEEEKMTDVEKEEYEKKKQAEEVKSKGNEAYKAKKLVEALEHYDKAISMNPKEPIYYLNKASVYLEMKKFEDCLAACDEAIKIGEELHPKPFNKIAKAYARKGNCYTHMKNWKDALEMYDKSLLEVNDPAVKEAKRNCEAHKKKEEETQYIDPAKAEEHREKGNKLFRDGNFGAAIKEYDEAIKRNPNSAVLYLNRGMSLMKILDHTKAINDIDKAIELDPKYVKAYAKKGNIHYFVKEYHKAIEAYNKGLEIDPTNEECLEGRQKTQQTIYQAPPDEERAKRAMADPEIRALLQDPRIIQVLKEAKENPTAAMGAMSDPFIAQAIQKLIAAGIIGVKQYSQWYNFIHLQHFIIVM